MGTIGAMREGDERWMRVALEEAAKGLGRTSPNPCVGCVIVKDGNLLASGWHRAAGSPHAEIEALAALPSIQAAIGADLYVTLEPCSTSGRTPPCTDALLRAGVARVIYGATDPNPLHAGRAAGILRAGGIEVLTGLLGAECETLNRAWNHFIVTGRPWVLCKAGMSLDGRISSHPESRWITSDAARADAMRLRARADAILVGGSTLRSDNPSLTIRGIPGAKQPLRAIWSLSPDFPDTNLHVFSDEHRESTLILRCTDFREVLAALAERDVVSLLVEGGGRVHGEIFDGGFANEVAFYYAPTLLGGNTPATGGHGARAASRAIRLENIRHERIGEDWKLTGTCPTGASAQNPALGGC